VATCARDFRRVKWAARSDRSQKSVKKGVRLARSPDDAPEVGPVLNAEEHEARCGPERPTEAASAVDDDVELATLGPVPNRAGTLLEAPRKKSNFRPRVRDLCTLPRSLTQLLAGPIATP
jgi:hypothetical protein